MRAFAGAVVVLMALTPAAALCQDINWLLTKKAQCKQLIVGDSPALQSLRDFIAKDGNGNFDGFCACFATVAYAQSTVFNRSPDAESIITWCLERPEEWRSYSGQ